MGRGAHEPAERAGPETRQAVDAGRTPPRAAGGAAAPSGGLRPGALEWLVLAGGLVLVVHYAWLLDDAYVYFRYVDNLLFLDRGLVYNPGEHAEGFTSPAWLGLLVALRALSLDWWLAIRLVAVLSFAGFWLLALRIDRELAPQEAPHPNLPLAFLSFHYAALCYFSSGTETPLVQLEAAAFALLLLRPASRTAGAAVAVSPLVRPELALPLLLALGFVRRRTGHWPWTLLGIALVANGGWLLFRVVYYADLFPTTFYLKNTSDPLQGLRFLHDTLGPYHLYEIGALALVATAWLSRRVGPESLRLGERAAMWLAAALVAAWVVKIGGDPRHYRYLAFPVCLSVFALGGLGAWTLRALGMRSGRRRSVAVAAMGVAVAALSFSSYPRQLERHPVDLAAPARLVDRIADAAHHRHHPHLPHLEPWGNGAAIELRPHYARWRAAGGADPPETVLPHYLCWTHYRHFHAWAVHSYGLTDPVLARAAAPAERPAHKEALRPMARDLADVLRWWGRLPERGMYRAAVEAGVAAPWIVRNLDALEAIEQKVVNRHRLLENLQLALRFPGPLEPDGGEDRASAAGATADPSQAHRSGRRRPVERGRDRGPPGPGG